MLPQYLGGQAPLPFLSVGTGAPAASVPGPMRWRSVHGGAVRRSEDDGAVRHRFAALGGMERSGRMLRLALPPEDIAMPDASEDISYRGFTLSAVRQGGEWLVTIWPTEVEQELPSPRDTPVIGKTKQDAFDLAKQEIDRLMNTVG